MEGQGDGGGRALQPWAETPFLCLLQPIPSALMPTQATQGWRAEGITAMPPLLPKTANPASRKTPSQLLMTQTSQQIQILNYRHLNIIYNPTYIFGLR